MIMMPMTGSEISPSGCGRVTSNVLLKILRRLCLATFFLLVLGGCSGNKKSRATDNGVTEIKAVREFESLFPDSYHFISYYKGEKGTPAWNSKIGLHGRYVLTVQFPIEFDETRLHPSKSGAAQFHLLELDEINENGTSYTSHQLRFGAAEWDKLMKSGGNFEVIGYPMIKDEPLSGFEGAWKES